jgi:hypothetical protein
MSKNNISASNKNTKNKNKKSIQNLLERLKEFQLAVYLSPGLSETQGDLLIRKFEEIIRGEDPEYTKTIKMIDGQYYLVDIVI